MKEDEANEEEGITFKVKKSKIGSVDSGIARIHSSYLEDIELSDEHLVSIKSEEGGITAKLVSDRLAEKGFIVLRSADIDDLKVDEGSEVTLEPYVTVKDEMKDLWEKFKARFKSDDDEEEEV
jgi:hypothetical protein